MVVEVHPQPKPRTRDKQVPSRKQGDLLLGISRGGTVARE